METLREFAEEKENLLKKFEIVEKMNLFPIDEITLENFRETKKNLEDEKFFVSITGQIKAGKSTLINALIFEDDILPCAVTPNTAKITLLKYSATPSFSVEFYNKEEWRELREANDFNEYLRKAVNESEINQIDVIYEIRKIVEGKPLEELRNYVSKGGKFTPFVNAVTIYYPNELLKDVIFVDTPGVNDPNPIRSKVTTDWIHKTDANVFLTYAGAVLSRADFDFIDKYLFGVTKEKKLLVISQIDTVNNIDGLEAYIKYLRSDPKCRDREIVGDADSTIYISALGALIKKIYDRTKKIPDQFQFHAERMERSEPNYLEEENNHLPELKLKIEEKLIANKGRNLLESKSSFLGNIFDRKIRMLQIKIAIIEDKLELVNYDYKELAEKRKNIKEQKDKLDEIMKNAGNDFQAVLQGQNYLRVFDNKMNGMRDTMRQQTKDEFTELTDINLIKSNITWRVRRIIDDNFNDIFDIINNYFIEESTNSIRVHLRKLEDDLRKIKILDFNVITRIVEYQGIDIYEEIQKIKVEAKNKFTKEFANDLVRENTKVFRRIFRPGLSRQEVVEALEKHFYDFYDTTFKNLRFRLINEINNKINQVIGKLFNILGEALIEKETEIKNLQGNIDNKEIIKKDWENKKAGIVSQVKEIEQMRDEINHV